MSYSGSPVEGLSALLLDCVSQLAKGLEGAVNLSCGDTLRRAEVDNSAADIDNLQQAVAVEALLCVDVSDASL